MNDIEKALRSLDPQEAARQAATALQQLLPLLGEEERSRFIMTLLGGSSDDKISSMVHL
jgi:DNA-directed RNA polymerase specialized sigma24 family protein